MATDQTINVENLVEEEKGITHAEPISWVFPHDNNNNDGPKDNADLAIVPFTPTTEIGTPSSRSIKRRRTPKTIPSQWVDNWIVKETWRKDGSRTDKTFRHKKEGFKVRSFKLVTYYELHGKLPEPKTKEKENDAEEGKVMSEPKPNEKENDGNEDGKVIPEPKPKEKENDDDEGKVIPELNPKEKENDADAKGKEILSKKRKKEDENVQEILSKKGKKKEEKDQINVEEFLAEAYNNLLHWFDK